MSVYVLALVGLMVLGTVGVVLAQYDERDEAERLADEYEIIE